MGNRDKGRAAVYTMAGIYLLYLAYKLLTTKSEDGGANVVVMIVFSIFFLLTAIALFGLSFYISKQKNFQNTKNDKADAIESETGSLEDSQKDLEGSVETIGENQDKSEDGGN